MAHILGLRIKNFKSLRDITLGQLVETKNDKIVKPLSPLSIIIGKNSTGKSALLDVFGFLADCLKLNIRDACIKRGGYNRIISKGEVSPIKFEIFYKEDKKNARPITYKLAITFDEKNNRPYAHTESLSQEKRNGAQDVFLQLKNGKGRAWSLTKAKEDRLRKESFINDFNSFIESQHEKHNTKRRDEKFDISAAIEAFIKEKRSADAPIEKDKTEPVALTDSSELGLSTLGALKENPRLNDFREFMEGWYLSYFVPDAARELPLAKPQQRLNRHGGNLANLVQYMEEQSPDELKTILKKTAEKIPGINKITTSTSPDGRLLLCFNDRGFKEPFFAPQMSDGTLKLFAYLLMLEMPNPPSFIGIEETENGLYHDILPDLVSEFRTHAYKEKGGSQIFITTHQPYLLDAATPEEVWILKKQKDGFSTIERASDNERVRRLIEEGDTLGELWFSDYLD